ncbi:hypothetical protein BDQ12DRAFT_605193 [Crucibulum laeve]|uniref:Integral membrane protein n=1 Tax=Crucibulum laeve TaxID=68775 RepID=A0A5C3M0M4_9AGAR|nr:hypothetical protein BDQ12DRAFT_605193 [Crucibulum laeve]
MIGIAFVLFVQCINALRQAAIVWRENPRWQLLSYTCLMFSLGTGYITTNTSYKILAFTTHRNFPGGPVTWVNVNYSSPTTLASNTCAVVSSWTADALLLYRCFIIYRSSYKFVRLILAFPVILFIGEVASGILLLIQVSHSPSTIWNSVDLGLPYFALAAACNVTITLTIATPLLLHRRRLLKTFGRGNSYSEPYTSAAAILVESSAVYDIVAVVFIGTYAAKSDVSHLFLSTLSQVQVIAPFLVILRVARKQAWTSTTREDIASATMNRFDHTGQSSVNREVIRLHSQRARSTSKLGSDFVPLDLSIAQLHSNRLGGPSSPISPISKAGSDSIPYDP